MNKLIAIASALLVLSACETDVNPFQESGAYFSIGGIVDASADTQYVRISPLRKSALIPVEPLDARVRSIDLETGAEAVWRDSLVAVQPSGFGHNFWTTFDFQSGRRYRLEVEGPEGATSSVEFRIPDTFPDPVVQQSMFDPLPTIIVHTERLADLRLLYCGGTGAGDVRRFEVSLVRDLSKTSNGYAIVLDPFAIASREGIRSILWMRIFAAAAGPDWPEFEDIDDETLAHPHTISNVEGGVGFLGGVTSKIVDWPRFPPQHPDCVELLRRW